VVVPPAKDLHQPILALALGVCSQAGRHKGEGRSYFMPDFYLWGVAGAANKRGSNSGRTGKGPTARAHARMRNCLAGSAPVPPAGSLWKPYHCILPPPTSLLTKYCPLPRNTR
jgi:hypothetical protein